MKTTRTNSMRIKALESLKKISEQCYDLTNQSFISNTKPLLCQTELINRTTPRLDLTQQSINMRSAPAPYTSRTIAIKPKRTTSIFMKKRQQSPENEEFCRKVYTMKTIELQAKTNKKQEDIFIKKLSKALTQTELNAAGYDFGPMGMKQICNYLVTSQIETLILDKNNLRDEGVLILSKVVGKMRLKLLSLVSVNMSDKSCRPLLTQLSKVQTLQHLNLSSFEGFNRNKFHKHALQSMGLLMSGQKANLKYLNLANTGIDDRNFNYICSGLTKTSHLQYLNVEYNEITEIGLGYFKQHIIKVHLQYFNFSYNKVSSGGLDALASVLGTDYNLTKVSRSLKILKVCGNNIKSDVLHTFCKDMVINQTLQELYLDDNPLGEGEFFSNFNYFIKKNWNIKKLSLSHSLRCTDDILVFCDCLDVNRGLQTLILSRNNIQYCCFRALIQVLIRNKSLKKIYLQGCNIVDSYIIKSEDVILQLKHIEEIYLDHNFITDKGAAILEKAIFRNKLISKLQLYNNCLSVKMLKHIQVALKYNEQGKKFDGPDLSYFLYVEDIQNNQKIQLQQTVSELKQREHKLIFRQLVHNIAKKQIEGNLKKNEIVNEAKQVSRIEEIQQNMNRIAELQKLASKQSMSQSQNLENNSDLYLTSLQKIESFTSQIESQSPSFAPE